MSVVVGLLVAAVLVAWLAPRFLTAGRWQPRRPRLALALWHLTLLLVLLLLLGATAVAVGLAAFDATPGEGGSEPVAIIGWVLLLGLGGAIVSLSVGSEGAFDDASAVLDELHAVSHEESWSSDGTRILTFDVSMPFACAVPGRTPTLIVTAGLRALLSDERFEAVLEHERAHLTYRHHLAMGIARLYAGCLPRTRTARSLLRTTRLLIELMADDASARRVGAVHLANALAQVGAVTGDASMIARAERLTLRRWAPARHLGERDAAPAHGRLAP